MTPEERIEELERENALLREGCLEIAKRCDNLLILLNKRNAELSKLYRRLNRVTGS